ncbi:MAG TPA: branched-chain amino acid ABC transporter permease [Stellaceae bacterium]|nr:branched-chain amino acid ABC transporter permease [Stellaceae bacterium]
MMPLRLARWSGLALALALMVAAPLVIGGYWLRILTSIYMYAVVAQGLNVIVGFAGYHAFGNVVFFGLGAYIVGVAVTLGAPLALAIVLAPIGAMLAAAVLGWPLLRLKGHYFAIATVALNLAMNDLIINVGGVTGGAEGLPMPLGTLAPEALNELVYFLMLGAMVASALIVLWLSRSPLGYALRALKDSALGAEVMGINTTLAKTLAWALSAGMTGTVGGIWGYWINFLEPGSAFDIGISVNGYIMMLVGGMGTVLGPVIGAFFLETVSTIIWGEFIKVHLLILGLLIILVVMLLPEGLLFHFRRLVPRRKAAP